MNDRKNWGRLIKFHRKQQGLKQDDLAVGICTSSYLSRIENEVVVAEDNVYAYLFSRLGVDIASEQEQRNKKYHLLEELYEKLLSNEEVTAQEIDLLVSYQLSVFNQDVDLLAKLVYIRYLLSLDQLDGVAELLASLEPFIPWQQDRVTQMYIGVSTNFNLSTLNYGAILKREQSQNLSHLLQSAQAFELANYVYHLAFAAHRTYAFQQALDYIERANSIFTHCYKPLFQLKLYSMHGVIFNSLGRFQEALKEYRAAENLMQYVSAIQTPRQFSSLYNNLAFCFECQEDYGQAQSYYRQSNDYLKDLHTVINWMRVCYRANDMKGLAELFESYPLSIFSVEHHIQQWKLLNYAAQDELTVTGLYELEVGAFAHFEEQKHYELSLFYTPLWANLYEQHHAYKPASRCYHKAFQASEKVRYLMNH